MAATPWTWIAWMVASLACLRMHRASPINLTPRSFSIDRPASEGSQSSAFGWVGGYACFSEEALPILGCHTSCLQRHVEFVKLFTAALRCKANRVAKEEPHLKWRRTIYGASHCAHTDTSLHGLWLAAGKMSGRNSQYIPAFV